MMNPHPEIPLVLGRALRNARLKHMPAGQIIFYEQDLPQEVFVLKSGIVKIYDIDEQGNEKVLHLVKPPALIPFAFFSGMRDPLRWFYGTLTDCELWVFSLGELQRLVRADSALAEVLTNGFSSDVHELLTRLSSLGKTSARDKVLATLRFLMVVHASERRASWWRVNFPVNHQLIADICGITRETAAITMKELQGEKVVRCPRVTVLEINTRQLEMRLAPHARP
jgi:CRP/FNR family transcriptional regulator